MNAPSAPQQDPHPKIFLSGSREDECRIRSLADRLKRDKMHIDYRNGTAAELPHVTEDTILAAQKVLIGWSRQILNSPSFHSSLVKAIEEKLASVPDEVMSRLRILRFDETPLDPSLEGLAIDFSRNEPLYPEVKDFCQYSLRDARLLHETALNAILPFLVWPDPDAEGTTPPHSGGKGSGAGLKLAQGPISASIVFPPEIAQWLLKVDATHFTGQITVKGNEIKVNQLDQPLVDSPSPRPSGWLTRLALAVERLALILESKKNDANTSS